MAKKKSKAKSKAKSKTKIKSKAKSKAVKVKKAKKAKKTAKASRTKAVKAKSVKAKKSKKPAPAKKKKRIIGEGDYQASREFDRDQSAFVKRNSDKIPAMGKAAEQALDGPEGDALREAEATAAARSRDGFDS